MGKSRYKLSLYYRHKKVCKKQQNVGYRMWQQLHPLFFFGFCSGQPTILVSPSQSKYIQISMRRITNHHPNHHPKNIQKPISPSHPQFQNDPEERYLLLLFDDSLRRHLHCFLSVWSSSHSYGRHLEVTLARGWHEGMRRRGK